MPTSTGGDGQWRSSEAARSPPARARRSSSPARCAIDPLFEPPDPARVAGASVTFEPGARTAWHTHPLGQTLIVTAGCGWAQREGGPVEEIRPGDVVWFPPGEKHWHGATATTAMTHIAIQEKLDGKAVDWMEQVSDEQYRAASKTRYGTGADDDERIEGEELRHGKGRVRDRGGERHRPRRGAGVRARGRRRGGGRRVGAGQPGNGPPDRGGRRAGARGPVRRDAGRGREGRAGQGGRGLRRASTSPSTMRASSSRPAPAADYARRNGTGSSTSTCAACSCA